jgi:C4-dicarboxylate-specific signal transduction histidine kinase
MMRFWALPLRRQLLFAFLLLLVPVLVAAVWSGFETVKERALELAEDAQMVSRTTAAYINRDIATLDEFVQRMAQGPAVSTLDAATSREVFGRVISGRSRVSGLALLSSDGREIVKIGIVPDAAESADWVADVLASEERITLPIFKAPDGQLYVQLGYPVWREGQRVGVLAASLHVNRLQDAFGALPLPPGSVVTVVDYDGRVLARSLNHEEYVGTIAPGGPREGPLQPHEAPGLDGVERVYAEALADAGPWIVSVGLPRSLAYERAASLWTRSFAILVLGLAGWLAVALVLSARLGNAVAHLDATAQRIAAGDFSPMQRQPMLSKEFAELQDAFDLMLRRFNATRQMLDAQMAEERRIRRELESLQGQVIRQERLAAVGQLVSGVAHEINNPLQAILGFAELLQMQGDVPDSVKGDLRLIQKESARACGIIRNLALFARQQPGAAAPVGLGDVMSSVAELRQRRLESEDIQLQVDDRSTQQVMAVLTELQQVVLNFVVNAEQAILASGRLPGRITMRAFDDNDRVVLEVEDTGPGVKPEDEAKLFQPFFTTKPVGQGTGLGLSISYGIIDSLGGQIGYRNASAGGSIFYFILPAITEA